MTLCLILALHSALATGQAQVESPILQNKYKEAVSALCYRDYSRLALLLEDNESILERARPQGSLLHIAATFGDTEAIGLLVRLGADLLARDSLGETALHKAAQGGRIEVLESLLYGNTDTALQENKFGWIPLHFAVALGNRESSRMLSLWGGIDHRSSLSRVTPLDLAYLSGDRVLIATLEKCAKNQGLTIEPWLPISAVLHKKPKEESARLTLRTRAVTFELFPNGAFAVDVGRVAFGLFDRDECDRFISLFQETGIEDLDDAGPALFDQETRLYWHGNTKKEARAFSGMFWRDRDCDFPARLVRLSQAFDVCEMLAVGAYSLRR